tara:strand:+ start:24983 stop:26344 length:1362 start_codon:yes stop_codon:yes gene_type:complete
MFEKDFFQGVDKNDRFICFADPSTYETNPGWPLRNLLVLIRHKWRLDEAQIMCYRDTHMKRDQSNSIILQLQSDPATTSASTSEQASERPRTPKLPKVTGWERTEAGKLTSRNVDLSEYMDERKLADQAVDLNLKLIKWRIAPGIDLDVIKNCKCLLLGAGTLGTYVSRTLMGWGVRKITFIDNATVSFSNPVRQPLFDFKDCLQGGAKKAERAAEALEEIYPGVDATGHVMEVPMLGHPMTDVPKTKTHFEKLQQLISEHDVIFLLMDTRESRWLPTLMGKAAGKIVLNAALGFDTYVVMRHGLKKTQEGEVELGCYFCNDVVAPADVSTLMMTLDIPLTICAVSQQRYLGSTMYGHSPWRRTSRIISPRRTACIHPSAPFQSPRTHWNHSTAIAECPSKACPSVITTAIPTSSGHDTSHHPRLPQHVQQHTSRRHTIRLLLSMQRQGDCCI